MIVSTSREDCTFMEILLRMGCFSFQICSPIEPADDIEGAHETQLQSGYGGSGDSKAFS